MDVRRWYFAAFITGLSVVNSVLRFAQRAVYGGRIRRTPLVDGPIVIMGAWRTGTTFLHELLVLDERHTAPTSYECFAPNHFLLTEWLFARLLWFLFPPRRPMDNMKAGWDRPQEDEFALCMLGQPSPYWTIAFPRTDSSLWTYAGFHGFSPEELASWKAAFVTFLRSVTLARRRRLVLKSPLHAGRIGTLADLFPNARFVYLVRDPQTVFASTRHLWRSLIGHQSLQAGGLDALDDRVLDLGARLHDAFERDRHLIEDRLHEIRYEDLIRDPIGELRILYARLGLGDLDPLAPALRAHVARLAGYAANRYELTPAERSLVDRRWRRLGQYYASVSADRSGISV